MEVENFGAVILYWVGQSRISASSSDSSCAVPAEHKCLSGTLRNAVQLNFLVALEVQYEYLFVAWG